MNYLSRFVLLLFVLLPLVAPADTKKPKVAKVPDYRTLVTAISPTSVTLTNQFDKLKKVYTITADTIFQLNDAPATVQNIKTGMQMEVFRLGSTTSNPPELAELDVKDAVPVEKP